MIVYEGWIARQISAVFYFIFKNVIWKDDLKTRGQIEHWGLPVFMEIDGKSAWYGDCDDFMSAFRELLKKLGLDERVLRKAVCFAPTAEKPKPDFDGQFNHALFCINTSRGLVFLDNRFTNPMTLSELRKQGYINIAVLGVDGIWHGV